MSPKPNDSNKFRITPDTTPEERAAIREAYRIADGVKFENAYRRSDIGQKALQAK